MVYYDKNLYFNYTEIAFAWPEISVEWQIIF